MTPRNVVIEGDALAGLRGLAPASVDCVITSPPYFQARNYGAGAAELGTEDHVDEWSDALRAVSAEIARVLVPTGSYWLNVGDLYSRSSSSGPRASRCCLGPERLVRGLLADGWIVRNRVAWIKSAPLPSPVLDRLTNTWEYVFHLVRQSDYFYDLDAIREPLRSRRRAPVACVGIRGLGCWPHPAMAWPAWRLRGGAATSSARTPVTPGCYRPDVVSRATSPPSRRHWLDARSWRPRR